MLFPSPSFTYRVIGVPADFICGESGGTSCFYDLAERYRLRNLVAEREDPPVTREAMRRVALGCIPPVAATSLAYMPIFGLLTGVSVFFVHNYLVKFHKNHKISQKS